MKFYIEGEKSKAVCEHCKELVNTTFKVRNVPMSDGSGTVKGLLVSVCDTCDKIVAFPHQSSIKIKEFKEQQTLNSIEARIPFHFSDILYTACTTINSSVAASSLGPSVFRYYVHHLSKDKRRFKKLHKYMESDLFKGISNNRFSIKLNESIMKDFNWLQEETKLNKSNLLKSIILLINDDINNKKYPKNIEKLKDLSILI